METQSDQRIRVVALANLRAMCERASGRPGLYDVVKVSRSRVHVTYAHNEECEQAYTITAVFPCTPGFLSSDDRDNPRVVLDILRLVGDVGDHGEGWQAFQPLLDCPTLWRSPDDLQWRTHSESSAHHNDPEPLTHPDGCTVCDLPVAYEAQCGACGWKDRKPTRGEILSHQYCAPIIIGGLSADRRPDVTVRAITRAAVSK